MTIDVDDLNNVAHLAYLEAETQEIEKLALEVNAIIDFVQQLQSINTDNVAPLFHPLNLNQPLREDEITEENCSKELASIAPNFDKECYFVPKFIDVGQ
ncbi:Asp-tRNA(Asn)/Glu-tRNA(Gln) amidotransferase subunit GatC [Legionella sp. CNM-1927-20]|uniref:Asp-tRNA(Asn)/Glu-tRNA(Gln) amidotransferase subunit GatC n=1 Tax=Legionella sp. CNM-1927-20 TaxID=3422221 RepID=UPI00403A9DCA